MFNEEVEWATENAPLFFNLLRTHAKDREGGKVSDVQFDTDIIIHVS